MTGDQTRRKVTLRDFVNFMTAFPNPQIQNNFGGGSEVSREELLRLAEAVKREAANEEPESTGETDDPQHRT
jgi:hypothetical protein